LLCETVERAVAPVFEPPASAEVGARRDRLYRKLPWVLVLTVGGLAVLILGWAMVLQFRSAENYFYQPLVSVFSLVAGLFVLSRFVIAAFYVAPQDVGHEPAVTVIVPCLNEGGAIRRTLECIFADGYADDKLEVVCVNDGSTDNTLDEMLATQTRHLGLVVVDFPENRGLCHAWAYATLVARGEIVVCVDSDTFLFPGCLNKIVQGFTDPQVGGVSGHCDVENAGVNLLTRMQDVRYFFSYKIMKAAESVFGCVSCLPGCLCAYRRACVVEVLEAWLNTTVLGSYGNFADDRSLTNRVLRHYKVIYDDQALATTLAPESWRVYVRQQVRWARSYLREVWRAGRFMWRKQPAAALAWYTMMWLPLLEPVVMVQALLVAPLASNGFAWSYLWGVLSITAVWSLHFWVATGRSWWWAGIVYTLSYMGFFSWQIYWALLSLRGRRWGTRG
jgi:hyaluronan synthase